MLASHGNILSQERENKLSEVEVRQLQIESKVQTHHKKINDIEKTTGTDCYAL